MTSFFCTSIALSQVSVTLLTDSGYPLRDIVRPIAHTLGIVATVVMLVLLLRMQSIDRRISERRKEIKQRSDR